MIDVNKLVEKSCNLIREIQEYIKSVPDWIYYWLPPSVGDGSANYPIKEFLYEYLNDWEDNISLTVNGFNGVSVRVHLNFVVDGDEYSFDRYAILSHFERDVEYNKKCMSGELNELLVKEIMSNITYHKEELQKAEEELKRLTNGQ